MNRKFRHALVNSILVASIGAVLLPVAGAAELRGSGLVDFDPPYLTKPIDKSGRTKTRHEYISVYYSTQTGRYGFASGPTVRISNERAEQGCKRDGCERIAWVRNQCIAVAAGTGKSFGYHLSPNKLVAETKALHNCKLVDYDCTIFVSACAPVNE